MVPGNADWSALGLTGNPFEAVAPGEHLEWADVAAPIRTAIEKRHFLVEVVGPRGAGKTTTLRWFASHHADARYVEVTGPALDGLPWPGAAALCLDDVDRASRDAVNGAVKEAHLRGVSLLLGVQGSLRESVPELASFELGRHQSLSWVSRRVAAMSLVGHAHFDFDTVAHALFPRVSRVNEALLRVLHALAENLARGLEAHDALDAALAEVRQDARLGPLLHG